MNLTLLCIGAAGSIINVLNNQWSCSIESVDLLPQPDLSNTDVAQNLSAAKRQPKTSAHSAETETVGETMTDACEKPAATEILEHQTSEKHLTSNETKTQSGRSRRTSRRLQDRQQRLSTHGCTSNSFVEIASRNTYYKSEYRCDDAEVDREDAAHSKTGIVQNRWFSVCVVGSQFMLKPCYKVSVKFKAPHNFMSKFMSE